MARQSPLAPLFPDAHTQPYAQGESPADPVNLIQALAPLEIEYASLRSQCVLLDLPSRGLIEVTGSDRLAFLNRMVTQELKDLREGFWRPAFWLNRKGRIDADLRILSLPDRLWLETDIHAVARTIETLSAFVISEDVAITDLSESHHRLSIHGPRTLTCLAPHAENPDAIRSLAQGACITASLAGIPATLLRDDTSGEIGLELIVRRDDAHRFASSLLDANRESLRPIGWFAYNIARIEAGTPLFNLDFGTNSTPAESGVLHNRVSFTKGCYLGQEIVARMHSRGHSKQQLVALRFQRILDEGQDLPRLPAAGSLLFAPGSNEPVGAITSSTFSPMLGGDPIAFAQVKPAHVTPGTALAADDQGTLIPGEVQPSLRFWLAPEGSGRR